MIIYIFFLIIQILVGVHSVIWDDEECMTPCVLTKPSLLGSLNWYCYTDWRHTKSCIPGQENNEVYYPSRLKGVWCSSRCGYFGSGYEWCFITDNKWAKCDSTNSRIINNTVLFRVTNRLYPAKERDRWKNSVCLRPLNATRRSRDNSHSEVNDLTRQILSNTRDYSLHILNNPYSSIVDYSTIAAPSIPNLADLELTVRIRAVIRSSHLNRPRPDMPSSLRTLMVNLNADDQDDRGHIIALSLGGTNEPFNVVPQYCGTNRRVSSTSHWWTFENEMRRFINQHVRNYVEIQVIVVYGGNLLESRRPTGFYLQAIFHNFDGSIDRNTGTCYFTNNPNPSLNEVDLGFPHDEFVHSERQVWNVSSPVRTRVGDTDVTTMSSRRPFRKAERLRPRPEGKDIGGTIPGGLAGSNDNRKLPCAGMKHEISQLQTKIQTCTRNKQTNIKKFNEMKSKIYKLQTLIRTLKDNNGDSELIDDDENNGDSELIDDDENNGDSDDDENNGDSEFIDDDENNGDSDDDENNGDSEFIDDDW